MKLYKKTIHLMFLITVFSVTVLVGSTIAGTYTITNLTNTTGNYPAQQPQINENGDIAWIQRNPDTGLNDAYLKVGAGVTNLSNNTTYQYDSSVRINDNGQVAWAQRNGVYLYDGTNTTKLSSASFNSSLQINNNGYVVWDQYSGGAYNIWLYDGTDVTNLTNLPSGRRAQDPQINDNGYVVWSSDKEGKCYYGGCPDVYLYDGTNTTNLTQNTSYGNWRPQINNNGDVVWHHWTPSYSNVYLYNGTVMTNLTNNVVDGYNKKHPLDPQIDDSGHVVWHQESSVLSGTVRSYVRDVYIYDGAAATNITNNPSRSDNFNDIYNLQINNNGHVVWDQKSGGETSNSYVYDAYIYDGADVTSLTNKLCGSRGFTYPQINDNGHVVWQLYHMYDSTTNIYLATAGVSDNNDNDTDCSGAAITNLTDNSYGYKSVQAQISDSGHVVWYQVGGEDFGGYLYDGFSTIRLSNSYGGDPQVNDNGHVVWSQYYDDIGVYLYDGSSTIRLSSSSSYYPQINDNGHVAWSQQNGSMYDVYLYDGTDTTKLSSSSYSSLQINNSGHVVWGGRDGVYLYDGEVTTSLSGSHSYYPQINDSGHVVWSQSNGVYLYDGTGTTKLSSSYGSSSINNSGHVVWSQSNGSVYDVYLYDGTDTTKFTSSIYAYNPQINDNGHVVWVGREGFGSKRDLYFYDGEDITNLTSGFCGRPDYYNGAKINNNGDVVLDWNWYKDGIIDVYLVSPCIPNTPPVADAGSDQTVEQTSPAGAQVVLDGTGSYDDDGDTLAYTWTGPFGTVTGPVVTVTMPAGTSNASLVVNDGTEDSTLDSVIISVQDTTPPHNVVATLEPIKVRKKHGCFRVVLTAEDNGDASPLTFTAVLKTGTCQEEVSNGDTVRLHLKKKRCRIKHDDGSSGHSGHHKHGSHDDDSSSADCGTVKFEGPDFTLTATATDARGNESDFVNAAPPVFGRDGDSRSDDGSSSGHKKKKKKKKRHGSDDDSRSGHGKKK